MRLMIATLLVAWVFSASVNAAPSENPWASFDKPPLTIIYPDNPALSNPPFLHWQAQPDADRYSVHLSSGARNFSWRTNHNFYTPVNDLDSGATWTLVITAFDKSNKALGSSQKNFFVDKKGAGLNLDLNNLSFEKGRLFYPSEEQLKTLKAESGWTPPYKSKLITYAQEPLTTALLTLKEQPSYKDNTWNLEQWKLKNDAAFAVRGYVVPASLAWRLTGDRALLANVKKFCLQVADWDPVGGSGLWDNDHSAQALIFSLSIAYNLLQGEWTPAEKEKILRCIKLRAEDFYKFQNPFLKKTVAAGLMNDPDNNHPWFCTAGMGIGAMALMGEDPMAEEWLSFAAQLFYGVYFPRGGAFGEWHEGIDYWSYTLYFVFQFNDALKAATGVDLYRHPWMKSTAFFKIYTHPPQGGYVPFGDSKNHAPDAFDKLVMMRMASVYDDLLAWRYVDAIPNEIKKSFLYDALLWDAPRPEASAGDAQAPFAFHYKDIGWVVSNNNIFDAEKRVLFAMRCGKVFGTGAHSHGDQNHFIITAGSDRLIWDAGYYDWHGSPHHKAFTIQTRAHNAILIDGEGQQLFTKGTDGRIAEFAVNGKSLSVVGDASNPIIYGGRVQKYLRSIKYENEQDFVIRDEIILMKPGRISWLLHSDFPIIYEAEKGTISIKGKQYQLSGRFETAVAVESKMSDQFPVDPNPPLPKQYHLEIKTKEAVREWSPALILALESKRQ